MICNSLILNFYYIFILKTNILIFFKKLNFFKNIYLITNLNDSFLKIRLLHSIEKALLMPTQFIS